MPADPLLFPATFLSSFFVILALVAFLMLFWKAIKKVIINSVTGVFALLVLHYVFGVKIPLTLATLLITALFGLAGVGTMLILDIAGLL